MSTGHKYIIINECRYSLRALLQTPLDHTRTMQNLQIQKKCSAHVDYEQTQWKSLITVVCCNLTIRCTMQEAVYCPY